jgi:Mg2+ and Co2+ transporter CorA
MTPVKTETVEETVARMERNLKDAREVILRQQSELSQQIADIIELRSQLNAMRRVSFDKETVEMLAKAYTDIDRGNPVRARDRIECVLADMDSAWRTLA